MSMTAAELKTRFTGSVFDEIDLDVDAASLVDFALAYALLNFIGSLAAARFLHRFRQKNSPGPLAPHP